MIFRYIEKVRYFYITKKSILTTRYTITNTDTRARTDVAALAGPNPTNRRVKKRKSHILLSETQNPRQHTLKAPLIHHLLSNPERNPKNKTFLPGVQLHGPTLPSPRLLSSPPRLRLHTETSSVHFSLFLPSRARTPSRLEKNRRRETTNIHHAPSAGAAPSSSTLSGPRKQVRGQDSAKLNQRKNFREKKLSRKNKKREEISPRSLREETCAKDPRRDASTKTFLAKTLARKNKCQDVSASHLLLLLLVLLLLSGRGGRPSQDQGDT